MLKELNWQPFLYKKLCKIIENYSVKNGETKNYMVFDFDQTIINGDIEENLMMYMANNFLYKLTPKEFKEIISSNIVENSKFENGKFTIIDLIDDLSELYEYLWNNKDFSIDNEYFISFRAKIVYFYYNTSKFARMENGKIWPTYLFQNYTQEELDNLVKNLLTEMIVENPRTEFYKSSEKILGKCRIVDSKFTYNLKFKPEMIDLFDVINENNIVANIISASPISLIKAIIKNSPLKLSKESMLFGIPHLTNSNGKLLAKIDDKMILSRKEGKTQIIKEKLAPVFENKEPLAIFGDSMGDFSMLTSFEDSKINVLFDRNLNDDTRKIVLLAKSTYGKDDAKYFTQGYF